MNVMALKTATKCLVWLCLLVSMTNAADPDPLQDFCVADTSSGAIRVNGFVCKDPQNVTSSDFVFRGLRNPGLTNNTFGVTVTPAAVGSFPAVNTLGISMNRVDLAPGGVNPPHFHPRSTEMVFCMKGTIIAGFVSTNNVLYYERMKKGDVFVIPRGLVHFQMNVGKGSAIAITSFNSQQPGAQILPLSLFGSSPEIPVDVLSKAFQISHEEVKKISSKFAPK